MKPWFTYLSFQSVHDPLQVSYTLYVWAGQCPSSILVLVQVLFGSSRPQELKVDQTCGGVQTKFSFLGLEVAKMHFTLGS